MEIYVAQAAGAPMIPVNCVQALANQGLEDDRYTKGAGTYSKFPGAHDVTLIEFEALLDFEIATGIALHPAQMRRNLLTHGVRLEELIGKEFTIGPVRFLGLRPCPPCLYLVQHIKLPEVLRGMARSGGIYAQILEGGPLTMQDELAVVSPPQPGDCVLDQ